MYSSKYYRDPPLSKLLGYCIGTGGKRSHGGYSDQIRSNIKIYILYIIIYNNDFKSGICQSCNSRKTQLGDRVSAPFLFFASKIFLDRKSTPLNSNHTSLFFF